MLIKIMHALFYVFEAATAKVVPGLYNTINNNKFLFDRYMKTSNNLKQANIRSKLGVSAQ